MTALTETDRTRLIRLLGMCGSNFSGERDNAILAAQRLLRQLEMSWDDIIRPPGAIAPRSHHWRDIACAALRHTEALTAWEIRFLASIGEFRRPSASSLRC